MLLATIPFRPVPTLPGPLPLHTFGLLVALGIIVGARLGARLVERAGGDGERFERMGYLAAAIGLVGARLAWVLTHLDRIDSFLDVVAVWDGGLQFSGGFVLATLAAIPMVRRLDRPERLRIADGAAVGLVVGQAIGRLGCIAVGEHWGGPTDFPLALRYLGGQTAEGELTVGVAYHNTALYELLHLTVLALLLWWLLRRGALVVGRGRIAGVFLVWYGVFRAVTDVVRVGDETVLGLTGAQWVSLFVLVPVGLVILARTRHAGDDPAGVSGPGAGDDATDPAPVTS